MPACTDLPWGGFPLLDEPTTAALLAFEPRAFVPGPLAACSWLGITGWRARRVARSRRA